MAVALGLLAALLWGLTDFLIRVIGRSVGVHRTMLYAQGLGAVSVGLYLAVDAAARQPLHDAPWPAIVAAFGAAVPGFVATLSLYRGLRIGRVALVSPICSAYGAVTALLALAGGEPIGRHAMAGIAVIVAGTVLVSTPAREGAGAAPYDRFRGGAWAIVACVGYGLQFWLQGRLAVPALGGVVPVWIYYLCSTAVLGGAAIVRRPPLALSGREALGVFGTGTVAVLGFVVASCGLATGQVAVVTVLSSLQSAVTVGLASTILRERLARHQWVGVAAIVAGLGLVRLG